MHDDDGLAYVKDVDDPTGKDATGNPKLQMSEGLAFVPESMYESVIESAEECPGECIFIELE